MGQKIFSDALADYSTGQLARTEGNLIAANLVALLAIATPDLIGAQGIWLLYAFYPYPLGMVVAVLMIALAINLMPRRAKLPKGVLGRQDMPQSFALLDQICARMGAQPIDGLVIDLQANASVMQCRGKRILTIGCLLWDGLSPDQRMALLAHEVAHLVNNDPARSGLIWRGLSILDNWHAVLSVQITGQHSLVVGAIITPLGMLCELLLDLLLRLSHLTSQRKEYMADALAAELAGQGAMISLLEAFSLSDLMDRELLQTHVTGQTDGLTLLRSLATAESATAEQREAALRDMRQQALSVDVSHPATVFRIAFLQALPHRVAKLPASTQDWQAIDLEWLPKLEMQGELLLTRLEVA